MSGQKRQRAANLQTYCTADYWQQLCPDLHSGTGSDGGVLPNMALDDKVRHQTRSSCS